MPIERYPTGEANPKRPMHAKYPTPTVSVPEIEVMCDWEMDGGCEATDGCWVETDGICMHGHRSWLLHLGMI